MPLPPELQIALTELDTADTAWKAVEPQIVAAQATINKALPAKNARQQALTRVQQLMSQHYPPAQ